MKTNQDNHLDSYIIAPHFSTKLFKSQINYIKKYYSDSLFQEICEEMSVPVEYLLTDDNWVSADFNRKFADLIRIKTGDDEIFRKIGYYMLIPENINHMEYFLLKTSGPFLVFKHLNFYLAKVNRISAMEITRERLGKYRLRVNAIGSHDIVPDFYPNMLGVLEGFGPFFDLKNLNVHYTKITENTCVDYIVEFSVWREYLKMLMRILIIIGASILFARLFIMFSGQFLLSIITILNIVLLSGAYFAVRFGSIFTVIDTHNKELFELSLQKNERLRHTADIVERKNNEAHLLGAISQNVGTSGETREVIKKCIDEVKLKFNYEKVAVFLNEGQSKKLKQFYSLGFSNEELQLSEAMSLESLFSATLISCPIRTTNKPYGLFVVRAQKGTQALKNHDKIFFENLANMLGLLLENENNALTNRQAAHDIRSPLSVLNMLLPSINSMESEEKIELARMAVARVNNIADDILRNRSVFSQKDSAADLSDLIENILTEKKAEFSHKNIEFIFENRNRNTKITSISVSDLSRILSNLINNSVEAIVSVGVIKITLEDLNGKNRLSISDNGKGIPAEVLEKIGTAGYSFNKSHNKNGSGAGLGVYNAKRIINSTNGAFHIDSKVDVGTTVTIVI